MNSTSKSLATRERTTLRDDEVSHLILCANIVAFSKRPLDSVSMNKFFRAIKKLYHRADERSWMALVAQRDTDHLSLDY